MNLNNLREFVEVETLKGMTPEEINKAFNELKTRADTAEQKLAEYLETQTALTPIAEVVSAYSGDLDTHDSRRIVALHELHGMQIGLKLYAKPQSEQALTDQLAELEELTRMQQVAISVTAMCNTRQSAAEQRLDVGNPYRTTALRDVEAAVDREMDLREQLLALKITARKVVRDKLDEQRVHPCDENDDAAKARQLDPTWQNLYELTKS